jgi:hypothetical protein
MTQISTVWQFGSTDPDNANNLATIRQWWTGLSGKKINWRQRLLSGTVDAKTLNWEAQRFDESFVLANADLRGITLYWTKVSDREERNSTPDRLELDGVRQQLYIFPKSQKELVIRIEVADLVYQSLKLHPSKAEYVPETKTLILRDELRRVELEVVLSPELVDHIRQQLTGQ